MKISETNIYPLNEENLQAMLDYFFPFLQRRDRTSFFREVKSYKVTLKDLEYAAQKIMPFIHLIEERLGEVLTQINALDYAIEIFLHTYKDFSELAPERVEIIKFIHTKAGIDETYEDMLGKENRVFIIKNWN